MVIDNNALVPLSKSLPSPELKDAVRLFTATRLKDIRQLYGLTQEDIATKTGVPSRQISNYECGKNQVPLHIMVKISESLQISLLSFFSNDVIEVAEQNRHI